MFVLNVGLTTKNKSDIYNDEVGDSPYCYFPIYLPQRKAMTREEKARRIIAKLQTRLTVEKCKPSMRIICRSRWDKVIEVIRKEREKCR